MMIPNYYLSSFQWDHYVDFATGNGDEPTREGFEEWAEANAARDDDRYDDLRER